MKTVHFMFSVQINGHSEHSIVSKNGLYNVVALESLSAYPTEKNPDGVDTVKIWQQGLVDKFGYLRYEIKEGKVFLKR